MLNYFYESSNFLEVLEICRSLPGTVQKSPDLAFLHAKAHLEMGEEDEAERLFWKLTELRRNPGLKAVTYMELARLRKRQRRLEDAAELFEYAENAAAKPDTVVRALCEQGVLFTQLQKLDEARTCFAQASKHANLPQVNGCAAWCFLSIGRFSQAVDQLRATRVTKAAGSPYAQCKYLLALCFLSQPRQALELLFAVAEEGRFAALCAATCGVILARAHQMPDAIECFWRARDLGMNEWRLWHNMQVAYTALGDDKAAAFAEENVRKLKPELGPSSAYVLPSIDPVDFMFTGTLPEYRSFSEVIDFRRITADKATSVKGLDPPCEVTVLQTTNCDDDDDEKVLIRPIVSLAETPLDVPSRATRPFLDGLVGFFQRIIQRTLPGKTDQS